MGLIIFIIPLILLYFFLIRPQQRRMRERQQMVTRLKPGDEVITVGGIVAVVTETGVDGDEDLLLLEVAEGIEIAVVRRGIAEIRFVAEEPVVPDGPPALVDQLDELSPAEETEDTADKKDD